MKNVSEFTKTQALIDEYNKLKNKVPKFKVSFPDFPFLGIWTKKNAPFICIEPWLGLADIHHTSGKLEEKEGILSLAPGSTQSHQWNVEFY